MKARQTGWFGRAWLRLGFIIGLAPLWVLALAPVLRAQSTSGMVTGVVSDVSTGKYLEGAEVAVQNSALQTATERDGTFTLRNVPAGAHKLVIAYPGMESEVLAITVTAGQALDIPVKMTSLVVQMAEFKVIGAKEGMSQAIALQNDVPQGLSSAIFTNDLREAEIFVGAAMMGGPEFLKPNYVTQIDTTRMV